jgi:hypothetical protein
MFYTHAEGRCRSTRAYYWTEYTQKMAYKSKPTTYLCKYGLFNDGTIKS